MLPIFYVTTTKQPIENREQVQRFNFDQIELNTSCGLCKRREYLC